VGRAAKWLATGVASVVAFGLSLWLAAAVKLSFLPKADADRWVVNAAFATAMAACVVAERKLDLSRARGSTRRSVSGAGFWGGAS